jgi:hypothetical protein
MLLRSITAPAASTAFAIGNLLLLQPSVVLLLYTLLLLVLTMLLSLLILLLLICACMCMCSPTWAPIKIPLVTLSGGDVHRPLLVEVFGWNKSGAHTLWASTNISVNDCMTPNRAFQLTLHQVSIVFKTSSNKCSFNFKQLQTIAVVCMVHSCSVMP